MRNKKPIEITGVWLRRRGPQDYFGTAEVLVEVDGVWRLCIEETEGANYSHIIEPLGILNRPVDDLLSASPQPKAGARK